MTTADRSRLSWTWLRWSFLCAQALAAPVVIVALFGVGGTQRNLSTTLPAALVALLVPVVFWRAIRHPRTNRWLAVTGALWVLMALFVATVAWTAAWVVELVHSLL